MPAANQPATFFMAATGSDAWAGTMPTPNDRNTDGPLATLEQVQEVVRESRAADRPARRSGREVRVIVRSRTYPFTQTLVLGPEDSGKEGSPTIYTAYPVNVR